MKYNYITLILATYILTACVEKNTSVNYDEVNFEDSIVETENSTKIGDILDEKDESLLVLTTIYGDLDKDGENEKVEVIETGEVGEYGNKRMLNIYKKNENGSWKDWQESTTVILSSEEGGMMGDPFDDGIEIENGTLLVYHSGGSSWKWSYTQRFRFQNNSFELIGATTSYGKFCEEWEDVDYNLSTGKINYTFTKENCDGEGEVQSSKKIKEKFIYKMEELPKLNC